MPANRMNREQFYAQLSELDTDRLKKALWTLYWRGAGPVRARIEAEITPGGPTRGASRPEETIDPDEVLADVREFVDLARSGAYIGGDRRVRPSERTRWRFTFRRLADDALAALGADDIRAGAAAVELLIGLACRMRDYDCFRSEDPVEAAGFVVSDAAATLWTAVRERDGFAAFADRAAPQLIRWESRVGWTRFATGRTSAKEATLGNVIAGMLPVTDMWIGFADRYIAALDELAHAPSTGSRRGGSRAGSTPATRAERLAGWHRKLFDRLIDTDAEDRLDALVDHPALGGPEMTFLKARLAHHRGDIATARKRASACLRQLPGHREFMDFAAEINAETPDRAQRIGSRTP